jgi:hypothetical protein
MIDFSHPGSRHEQIGAAPQAPIESPFEEEGPLPREPRAAVATSPRRRSLRSLWRAGDGSPKVVWVKKMIAFPIGERFAAISISAVLFSARTTFIVLLVWGGFAAAYVLVGRALRSLAA